MKQVRVKLRVHSNMHSALGQPSLWAGVAGILSTTGLEMERPLSTWLLLASALCSLVAVFLKPIIDTDIKQEL